MLTRTLFSLLLLALFCHSSFAQRPVKSEGDEQEKEEAKKDVRSPDSAYVAYFHLNTQGAYTYHSFSRPLTNFQEYDRSKKNNQFYANLGNPGSASFPLFYKISENLDFSYRPDVFDPFRLKDDSIRVYISKNPFSHVQYIMGADKEQHLDFHISEHIGNGLYIGLDARYSNVPGAYTHQRAYYAGGDAFIAFIHPAGRYGAFLTIKTDKISVNENGGLAQPDYFIQNIENNRQTMRVNLSSAINRDRNSGVVLQQYINILKPKPVKKADSSYIATTRKKFDAGRFVHTFKFSRITNAYADNAPELNFYPIFYGDSSFIYDSVRISHLENILVYSNEEPDTSRKAFPLQYSFGIKQQMDKLWADSVNTNFNQLVPFGMLKGIIKGKTFFKASANLVIGGYRSGDYLLEGNFYQFFGKRGNKLYANVVKGLSHPEYFFSKYNADNFRWDNSLNQLDIIKAELGATIRGFSANASFSRISNFTYLNKDILPVQNKGGMTVSEVTVSKIFTSRHLIASVFAGAQRITPDSILQLPAFIGKLTFCYDAILFKKALHAQIGLSGTYHTTWYQDAYMPALRSFYRQDFYLAGNYPYLDVFVNFNVKRARLFLKYEHFNAGFFGYNYIMVPYYAQPDAKLKFGISWVFFD